MARNKNERDLDGWENAPVPICMGGDYRALSWCCKPGYSLTFGFKCLRDEKLKEIGMSLDQFVQIKSEFSQKNNWNSQKITCFGSLTYCCMRNGGCMRRDTALKKKYPNEPFDKVKARYFVKKKELAKILLENAPNQEAVQKYLKDC